MTKQLKVTFLSAQLVEVEIVKHEGVKGRFNSFWDELRANFFAFNENSILTVILVSGELYDETDDELSKDPSARSAFERAIVAVENCTKVTVCLMHSACSSPGFVLASACDIRTAASGISINVKDITRLGSAGNRSLKRLYGTVGNSSWTNSVVFGALPFNAEEAFQNRLISKVWKDENEARVETTALAHSISKRAPKSTQYAKGLWVAIRNASEGNVPTTASFYSEEEAKLDLDRALGVGLLGVRARL